MPNPETRIVADIFSLKDRLLCLYRAYIKAVSKFLSKKLPEYQSAFEKVNNTLNHELQVKLARTVRNLFMTKNISSVMKKFNRDIIVMVGGNHTVDDKEYFERSIQTILKDDFLLDEKDITLTHINEGFDVNVYLGLEQDVKAQPLSHSYSRAECS
jgi:hypothetical protein